MRNDEVLKHAVKKGYHFNELNEVIGPMKKPLKLLESKGYPAINISYNKKVKHLKVHRLKAYFLFGNKIFDKELEVRHKDGDKFNFNDSNIAIGTKSENAFDRPADERRKHAITAASILRKFTKKEIEAIIIRNKNGESLNKLAKEYRVAKSTLSYIINKKTYKTFAV